MASVESSAVNVGIIGNHASVSLQSSLRSLCKEFNISLNVSLSAYDDSLSLGSDFDVADVGSSILVFWVDLDRYSLGKSELVSFLSSRHQEASSSHRVLMVVASRDHEKERDVTSSLGNLGLTDIYAVTDRVFFTEMPTFVSRYREEFQGSSVDPRTQEAIATHILTVALTTSSENRNLKLVVLDLDDTLYEGSLIDDGLEGISFGPIHRALISLLETAGKSGVVFSIASRNHIDDVSALLDSKDFETLRPWVALIRSGFGSKAEMVSEILETTNLSPSDALFIDDNSQNLSDVKKLFPEITLIQGGRESSVRSFASLSRIPWNQVDEFQATRVESLRARAAAVSASKSEDFSPTLLSNSVGITTNRPEDWQRVWSLINRTNQFNSSLSRGKSACLNENPPMAGSTLSYIAASHADDYADNGIVAAIVSEKVSKQELIIHELVASCRVLGRGLDSMILDLLLAQVLTNHPDCQNLTILWQDGPKNALLKGLLERKFSYSISRMAFTATRGEVENVPR